MREFIGKDFLLSNETAKRLFDCAKDMPIFDYHCHLSEKVIEKDVPGGKREWEIRERPQNITIQKYGLSQGRISVSLMQHSLL